MSFKTVKSSREKLHVLRYVYLRGMQHDPSLDLQTLFEANDNQKLQKPSASLVQSLSQKSDRSRKLRRLKSKSLKLRSVELLSLSSLTFLTLTLIILSRKSFVL